MRVHWKKRLLCLLCSVCIVLSGIYAVQALYEPAPQTYRLIWGETDENGFTRAEYAVDPYGNEVERATGGGVSASADSLPSKFDVRAERCVTSVKDQGGASCCWAFSSTSAMEISYVRQGFGTVGDTDFSEAYLTWFGQRQRTPNTSDPTYGDGLMMSNPFLYGGNWQIMAATLLRGSGMQLERNAPWYVSHNFDEMMRRMEQPESERYVSYARLWSAEGIMDLSRERAKQLIMENGSMIMSYLHDNNGADLYFNTGKNAYYRGIETSYTNHSVAVIGWDDTFSRNNFKTNARPKADGAWLVKGSWNTYYGDGGYYWISYEEPSIRAMASFRAAPADLYDTIYQYDGTYPSEYFINNEGGSGMANLFTAAGNEKLTHVAFFNINQTPIDVTAKVYVPGGVTNPDLSVDPTNGLQLVGEATTTMENVGYGYFTMELKKPVQLSAGDKFLVFVTFNDRSGAKVLIPAEGKSVDYPPEGTLTYDGHTGESFVYLNGTWFDSNDMTLRHIDHNNVPVKAMTKSSAVSVSESLQVHTQPRRTQYAVGESFDSTGLSLLYTDNKGVQNVVTGGFSVSAQKFSQPGDVTLTVTYKGLVCTLTVTVNRTAGDANGDGVLDLRDVVLMKRILSGWNGLTYYDANLDVNGDGVLNLMDVVLLSRYLAGGFNVVLV